MRVAAQLSKTDYLCVGTDCDAGEINVQDWIILRVQSSAGGVVLIFLNSFTKKKDLLDTFYVYLVVDLVTQSVTHRHCLDCLQSTSQ